MTRIFRNVVTCVLPVALLMAMPAVVAQEKYPAKAIEIIVPWGPGGGADIVGRLVGRWLEKDLGIATRVLNQPGAVGVIGYTRLAAAPPDGYTLAVATPDAYIAMETTQAKIRPADFVNLAVLVRQYNACFVRTNSRFKVWDDIVREAKANPGKLTIANAGVDGVEEVFARYLRSLGIPITSVAYPRPGERFAAVMGSHVDILFEQAGDVRGQLDAKQFRPVFFFAPRRQPAPFDSTQVSGELGYSHLPQVFRGIALKAGTDPQRVAVLAASLKRLASSPDYTAYLRDQFAEPDSFLLEKDSEDFVRNELDTIRRLAASVAKFQ